jgi:ankyrin repeat protein
MKGNTALILAIHTISQIGITKLLIENEANVSAENNENETPLMYASWSGKKDIVKLLLANGANANKKNKNGDTALMLAEKRGHTHIIRLLKNVDLK